MPMIGHKRTSLAHLISLAGSWWGIICSVILVYAIHPIAINKILYLFIWVFLPTLFSEAIKMLIKRPRPVMRGEAVKVKTYGYSFPSSHTVAAVMVAAWVLLFPELRWWSWLFLGWPVLVGWSRVWLRAHDAIDVAGGVVLAVIFSLLLPLVGLK